MPAVVALALLGACAAPDPHKVLSDASSGAASARMLVDARVKGHVTRRFAARLLDAERLDAHALAGQLRYERMSPAQREDAVRTMTRLGAVLDVLATDAARADDAALARDAVGLDLLKAALDSLSAAPGDR